MLRHKHAGRQACILNAHFQHMLIKLILFGQGGCCAWTRVRWKWQQHSENLIYFFSLWRRLRYQILQYQTETAQPHLWHERGGLTSPLQTCMSRKEAAAAVFSAPEMQVDKPLCCLRREQVITAGILTSVCQSEGQLCPRGRSMLICSAGKDYHSPLKLWLVPLCSHG